MTALTEERLREIATQPGEYVHDTEGARMARELLSLRASSAVAAADRALVDSIIGVGLEGMKPRRAGDPVCPEGYILVGLPFYDACRAARAAEGSTHADGAGSDKPVIPTGKCAEGDDPLTAYKRTDPAAAPSAPCTNPAHAAAVRLANSVLAGAKIIDGSLTVSMGRRCKQIIDYEAAVAARAAEKGRPDATDEILADPDMMNQINNPGGEGPPPWRDGPQPSSANPGPLPAAQPSNELLDSLIAAWHEGRLCGGFASDDVGRALCELKLRRTEPSPPCTVAGHAEAVALAEAWKHIVREDGHVYINERDHDLLDAYRAATTSRPQEEAEKLMREVFSPEHESPAYGDLLDGLADITKSPVRPVADAVLRLIDQRIAAALRAGEGA